MQLKNYTPEDLIHRTQLSRSCVYTYLNGLSNPKLTTIQIIANALEVPVYCLITKHNAPNKIQQNLNLEIPSGYQQSQVILTNKQTTVVKRWHRQAQMLMQKK